MYTKNQVFNFSILAKRCAHIKKNSTSQSQTFMFSFLDLFLNLYLPTNAKQLLKKDDDGNYNKSAITACKQIVDCLVENVLRIEEKSVGKSSCLLPGMFMGEERGKKHVKC